MRPPLRKAARCAGGRTGRDRLDTERSRRPGPLRLRPRLLGKKVRPAQLRLRALPGFVLTDCLGSLQATTTPKATLPVIIPLLTPAQLPATRPRPPWRSASSDGGLTATAPPRSPSRDRDSPRSSGALSDLSPVADEAIAALESAQDGGHSRLQEIAAEVTGVGFVDPLRASADSPATCAALLEQAQPLSLRVCTRRFRFHLRWTDASIHSPDILGHFAETQIIRQRPHFSTTTAANGPFSARG